MKTKPFLPVAAGILVLLAVIAVVVWPTGQPDPGVSSPPLSGTAEIQPGAWTLTDPESALTASRRFALSHARYMLSQRPLREVEPVSAQLRARLSTFTLTAPAKLSDWRPITAGKVTVQPVTSFTARAVVWLAVPATSWPSSFRLTHQNGRWVVTELEDAH